MSFRSDELSNTTVLILDRPPRNALDIETIVALGRFFRSHDPRTPLVVTGAGPAFSAGVDTKAFAEYDADQRAQLFDAITAMTAAAYAIDAPVVAAINGHALGGGLVLALCADMRIASEGDARYGLTEASAGVPFPDGPVEIIRSEIPAGLLRSMTLGSRIVSAESLSAHGIIDEVVAPEALRARAIEVAQECAAQPAFLAVKRQVRGPLRNALQQLVDLADGA